MEGFHHRLVAHGATGVTNKHHLQGTEFVLQKVIRPYRRSGYDGRAMPVIIVVGDREQYIHIRWTFLTSLTTFPGASRPTTVIICRYTFLPWLLLYINKEISVINMLVSGGSTLRSEIILSQFDIRAPQQRISTTSRWVRLDVSYNLEFIVNVYPFDQRSNIWDRDRNTA